MTFQTVEDEFKGYLPITYPAGVDLFLSREGVLLHDFIGFTKKQTALLKNHALAIPGHSQGSIGILTKNRDLFCGDIFQNVRKPELNSIMDDPAASQSSLRKLEGFTIRNVYPGHGKLFAMKEIAG